MGTLWAEIKAIRNKVGLFKEMIAMRMMLANLPAKDYPPANIAAWIKICVKKGREDLGHKIMAQWNAVTEKYPETRMNWPCATKLGANSIKKNVFGHKDFIVWLEQELGVPATEAKQLERSIPEPPKAEHPIQIPSDTETPEEWQIAAKKTAAMLSELHTAFGTADEQLVFLADQIEKYKEKLAKYGPGGPKSTNKDGTPSKFSERVPKWEAELKEFQAKYSEVDAVVKKEKSRVETLKTQYDNKRCTTVEYEAGIQKTIENTLQFILKNVNDPEKQKSMLVDLQKLMTKLDDSSEKAASAKVAGFLDKFISAFTSVFEYVKASWEHLVAWAKGLVGKMDDVDSAINPF